LELLPAPAPAPVPAPAPAPSPALRGNTWRCVARTPSLSFAASRADMRLERRGRSLRSGWRSSPSAGLGAFFVRGPSNTVAAPRRSRSSASALFPAETRVTNDCPAVEPALPALAPLRRAGAGPPSPSIRRAPGWRASRPKNTACGLMRVTLWTVRRLREHGRVVQLCAFSQPRRHCGRRRGRGLRRSHEQPSCEEDRVLTRLLRRDNVRGLCCGLY
jgi:hypothetical protein